MSDLVKMLRDGGKEASPRGELMWKASKRIEQLERELAIAEKMAADANEAYSHAHVSMVEALDQLTAEKALADRLYEASHYGNHDQEVDAFVMYCRARGL